MTVSEPVTPAADSPAATGTLPADAPRAVLEVVSTLAAELHPGRRLRSPGLDASLDRDFGLDSLGRVELLGRLERRFGVRLPEGVLASAETPHDLVAALARGGGAAGIDLSAGAGLAASGEAEPAPGRTQTLVEVLEWHAARHPERRHILYYPGEGEPEELTYGDLLRRARGVAAGLAALGLERGGAVALMLPTSLDYFAAFYGILLAGGVPVPLYPPARRSQIEDHLRRQAGILRVAESRFLITFQEVLPLAHLLAAQLPDFRKVTTVGALAEGPSVPFPARVVAEDTAFLQFTSGSTGNPKGVVLTHSNLLANLRAIGLGAELTPADLVVSWLPLYHDMGLIGAWMGSLYFAMPLVLMSPLTFLSRPVRWLQAITRHRGTLSAAPNFAYELCAAKVAEEDLAGLDLSTWRMALNGAEPVSPDAIRRFTARFAPCGFRPGSMSPVYGLAECSLAVAFPPLGRPPRVETLDRETFQRTGRALPLVLGAGTEARDGAPNDDPHLLRFVSCGLPLPTCEVRVVDEAGRELPEREQGRVEFRGPSATAGYFRNPEATAALLHGDWRDSGDLGYIAEGEIYLTGRIKDVIIRGGRNLYPHELEGAVGDLPGVRKGCVAVFGSPDPVSGTERLVILAETRSAEEGEREELRAAIQDLAVDLLGEPADDVVLAPPSSVPKTSSGKIRRTASRELYESGVLGAEGRGALRAARGWRGRLRSSVGFQMLRLALSGVPVQLRKRLRGLGRVAYVGWAALVLALLIGPGWLVVVLGPSLSFRRRTARFVARLLSFLWALPLRLEGEAELSAKGPLLVAANHQSYLDGMVLTALLPPRFGYVVKRELEGSFLSRVFLRRLGAVFVERFDPAQGPAEVKKAADALRSGDSLVIFVEGTFRRWPGLLPFRMGAFALAVETGVPVVPLAIRGTRSVLRGMEKFLRRGRVEVVAAPAVSPAPGAPGEEWAAAVALRDEVRAALLARCGEPDLPALE